MKQLGNGLFEVPSDSDSSRTYIVNMTGAYPQCTCTAWAFNRNRAKTAGTLPKPCKHCTAVMRVPQSGWADMKAKQAEAEAAAAAAADVEKEAKADKMKAELLKMRNDLDGKPTPVAKRTRKPKTDPVETSAATDLLAQLEAQIQKNKAS